MPKSMRKLPTQARLRELFDYDPNTGVVRRRVTVNYNARKGDVIDGRNNHGYRRASVDGQRYLLHRLIYVWMRGGIPEGMEIDHDSGVRHDNSWDNLFLTNHDGNVRNRRMLDSNTSGITGVSWCKRNERWQVYINGAGRRISLGLFADISTAIATRDAADEKYDYHELHGKR